MPIFSFRSAVIIPIFVGIVPSRPFHAKSRVARLVRRVSEPGSRPDKLLWSSRRDLRQVRRPIVSGTHPSSKLGVSNRREEGGRHTSEANKSNFVCTRTSIDILFAVVSCHSFVRVHLGIFRRPVYTLPPNFAACYHSSSTAAHRRSNLRWRADAPDAKHLRVQRGARPRDPCSSHRVR